MKGQAAAAQRAQDAQRLTRSIGRITQEVAQELQAEGEVRVVTLPYINRITTQLNNLRSTLARAAAEQHPESQPLAAPTLDLGRNSLLHLDIVGLPPAGRTVHYKGYQR